MYFSNRGMKLKYVRKWFINKAAETEVLETVIKFIVGYLLSGDVTAMHYLNMLPHAKRYYPAIMTTIEKPLSALDTNNYFLSF